MSSSDSTYGDIYRYEPAPERTVAAIAIVLLTIIEIVLVGLFTIGLVNAWGTTQIGNVYLGLLLAMIFIDLSFILVVYRREFLPDVLIVKRRRRKWEDLYVSESDAGGTELTEGAWEQVKRAIYPFYRR